MKAHFQPRIFAHLLVLILFTTGAGSAPLAAQAQTFKILYSFAGGADGGNPGAGLVFDPAGNLYGSTLGGGDAGCFIGTCGVVFELTPGAEGWSESTLHAFTGGSDGGNPTDNLIFDAAGNLYGTADVGGVSCGHTFGCGIAFELTPGSGGWTETVLHSFQGGTDGYYPVAAPVLDKHRDLFYSTVENGGSYGYGMVYELTKSRGGGKKKLSTASTEATETRQRRLSPSMQRAICMVRHLSVTRYSSCSTEVGKRESFIGLRALTVTDRKLAWSSIRPEIFMARLVAVASTTRELSSSSPRLREGNGRRPYCIHSKEGATATSPSARWHWTKLETSTAQPLLAVTPIVTRRTAAVQYSS